MSTSCSSRCRILALYLRCRNSYLVVGFVVPSRREQGTVGYLYCFLGGGVTGGCYGSDGPLLLQFAGLNDSTHLELARVDVPVAQVGEHLFSFSFLLQSHYPRSVWYG